MGPAATLRSSHAADHDEALWRCLCAVLEIPQDLCPITAREASSHPLALGGIGLRSAVRTSMAAYWASWGDSLEMIAQRHPEVAEVVVHELAGRSTSLHLSSAAEPQGNSPGFQDSKFQRGMSSSLAGGHPRATLRKWKPTWAGGSTRQLLGWSGTSVIT